jgi:hypothetical protein
MRSPVDEPENEAERDACEERRCYRDIETESIKLDDNISRQAAEPELGERWPKQPRCNQDRPEDYQSAAHGLWRPLKHVAEGNQ